MSKPVLRDDERRLNLEQQKNRAKELRRAVAAGDPDAVQRILQHHPKAHMAAAADVPARFGRLSDALLVVAREIGLASWARLKAHAERLQRARDAIAAHGPAPDGAPGTLHVRCGSDIRDRLTQAGFVGDFLVAADPYWLGPLPRTADYIAVRARLIAERCDLAAAEVERDLARGYETLAQAAERYQRIVLWFEHDMYDQLALARVLAAFADRRPAPTVELICIDRFPVITRFNGLGQLSTAALRSLWDGRTPVKRQQFALGRAVWDALRETSPLPLHAIAAGGTPELPLLAPALRRHLEELPWTGDGLGLTQRLALQPLRDGPKTVSQLFRITQHETEPLPYIGDLFFRAVLRDMARAPRPAIALDPATAALPWPEQAYSLTADGAAVLAGGRDWLGLSPPERWVGGVRIASAARAWRWDAVRQRPVVRAA